MVDGNRINISMGAKTYPGKKQNYYITLIPKNKGDDKIDIKKPLQFETCDYEFNLIYYYELPIEILER